MSDKKEKKQKRLSYIVGLFKENQQNIDTFGINMYYSYYYHAFMEEADKMREQREEELTPEEVEYYEELFDMVSKIHTLTKDSVQEGKEEEVFH